MPFGLTKNNAGPRQVAGQVEMGLDRRVRRSAERAARSAVLLGGAISFGGRRATAETVFDRPGSAQFLELSDHGTLEAECDRRGRNRHFRHGR